MHIKAHLKCDWQYLGNTELFIDTRASGVQSIPICMFACAVLDNKVVLPLPLQVQREDLSCTQTHCLVSHIFRECVSKEEAPRSFLKLWSVKWCSVLSARKCFALFLVKLYCFPCLPILWFHLRLRGKMYALIDLMGIHSHMQVGAQQGGGTEDMLGGKSSTRGHQIRVLPSDRGCDWMDRKCVGVCVRVGYYPLCSEMFGGKRGYHVARLRFIPIQRTIIVDLALLEKARINRGLINQL